MDGQKPAVIESITITQSPPPFPPLHVHRFAWAMTVDGRCFLVCPGCGARG